MTPANMMKPEQKFFIASVAVCIQCCHFRSVLCQGIGARSSAVKSNAKAVCTVIVHRIPVGPGQVIAPGCRSVMMPISHDMMQPKWRHILYHGFIRLQHHWQHAIYKFWSHGKSLLQPFSCYSGAAKGCVPGQAAKCIPVCLA